MPPARRKPSKRHIPDSLRESTIERVMVLLRKTTMLAELIAPWNDGGDAGKAVYDDACAQYYNNPDKFPCQHPTDEAEFHKFWPVFDKMIAGVDGVETLFDAYIHQFFMFGAGQFISEVYLGQYPSTLVGGIWMEAQERNDALICQKQTVKVDLTSLMQQQNGHRRSASPSWTPILSIQQGGDYAFIDAEVQRRSNSGKVFTYTITRLDRDAQRRRVFIATCDDLDVEVVFSEEEMRVMFAEKQVTLPPSDDSSSSSKEN